jgi:hypothetical protein
MAHLQRLRRCPPHMQPAFTIAHLTLVASLHTATEFVRGGASRLPRTTVDAAAPSCARRPASAHRWDDVQHHRHPQLTTSPFPVDRFFSSPAPYRILVIALRSSGSTPTPLIGEYDPHYPVRRARGAAPHFRAVVICVLCFCGYPIITPARPAALISTTASSFCVPHRFPVAHAASIVFPLYFSIACVTLVGSPGAPSTAAIPAPPIDARP